MMIEKGDGYVSGEEISRKLGLSRTAVWKHIEELRREGYQIEARQRSGYRLVFRPDRILQEEIACHLSTRSFGRALRTLKTDRKSTRLNSSHVKISYAVFCLEKKNSTAC